MLKVCEEKGLRKPVCFQGDYNLITPGMETRPLPISRAHNMSFNAYRYHPYTFLISRVAVFPSITPRLIRGGGVCRPLAAGFLTGKLIKGEAEGTRFAGNNPLWKASQAIFSADDLYTAMKQFVADLIPHDMPSVDVAIRWIAHHSALGDADGIVIGASKTEQVRQIASMTKNGPLPKNVLNLTGSLWQAGKDTRSGILWFCGPSWHLFLTVWGFFFSYSIFYLRHTCLVLTMMGSIDVNWVCINPRHVALHLRLCICSPPQLYFCARVGEDVPVLVNVLHSAFTCCEAKVRNQGGGS